MIPPSVKKAAKSMFGRAGQGVVIKTRGRLALALLGMAALPVLLIGAFSYNLAQETLHERVYAQLNGVLDLKQTEVSNWLALVVSDTLLLANNYVNEEHLTVILDSPAGNFQQHSYGNYLTQYLLSLQQARSGYEEIFYVLTNGDVLLSTDPRQVGENVADMDVIQRTFAAPDEVTIQDMGRVNGGTEMAFGHVLHRVEVGPMTTTDVVIAAVIIRVRLEDSLFPILMNWPASRETGEIQLLDRVDGRLVYASPLRFSDADPLSLAVPADLQKQIETVGGNAQEDGIWKTLDYREIPILVGVRPVPEMGWVLAIQQAEAEALAPIVQLRNIWLLVTVVVLLAAFVVAGVLARNLTGPLNQLTQAARRVGSGQFETSVALDRNDEFGELAQAFNSMVASVSANVENTERHSKELQALVNLSDAFLSSVDVRLTLESALREGISITQAEAGAAFVMLENGEELQTVALVNFPDSLLNLKYPVDAHSSPGYAIMQRKAITSPDLSRETRFRIPPAVRSLGVTSNLTAPMLVDGRVVGAITLASYTPHEFSPGEMGMAQAIANHTAIALERTKLVNDISEMYDRTLSSLVAALDTRDRETEGHSKRVVTYTLALAEKMNVPPELRQDISRGAMLHDIGKIGVPDAILHKTGQLGEGEWAIVRKHPEWGKQILEGIRFLEGPAQMVLSHHERWDGSGYPLGLKGEEIPLGARIFAVVDAFDAMTSYRPYRTPETYQKARAEIRAGRGTQFDPAVVDAFLTFSKEDWMLLREHEGARPLEMGSLRRIGSGQLQAMNVIISAITSSLDINEVLERTAQKIVDVTHAAAAGIYLYDASKDELSFASGVNMPGELNGKGEAFPLESWLHKDLIKRGETEFLEDLKAQADAGLRQNWKSSLCIPLQEGERVAGALVLFSGAPNVFEEEERLMFGQVARQLGQALVNARLHERVRYQAITDGLTGAYNRRYLDDFLSIEVKRCQRYQRPMAIVLLDMDYFHTCNDNAGHQAGDKALRDVVQLLNLGVRSVDLVARYGGEEFLVVLPETESEGAGEVAERMRRLIEKHTFPCGKLTASLGVAASTFLDGDSPDTEELVGRADKALYRAKEDGRNRVQLWNADLTERRKQ